MKIRMKISFENAMAEAKKATNKESVLKCFQDWAKIEFRDQRVRATERVLETILKEAALGSTVSDIAAESGVSQPTVRKILRKRGIKLPASR